MTWIRTRRREPLRRMGHDAGRARGDRSGRHRFGARGHYAGPIRPGAAAGRGGARGRLYYDIDPITIAEPRATSPDVFDQVVVTLDPILEQLAVRVADLVVARLDGRASPPAEDRLLDVHGAARLLGVTPRWLYRRAKHMPFMRKLSDGTLRFSWLGLQRYIAASKRGGS